MIAAHVWRTTGSALDHPESVEKVCLMDIAPTLTMDQGTIQEFATRYMWWFFLIQASPLPEHMIGLDPKFYLEHIFAGLNKTPGAITRVEMSEYIRAFSPASDPRHLRGFSGRCGHRPGNGQNRRRSRQKDPVSAPCVVGHERNCRWDILATWRAKCAAPVNGRSLDCGHFLQEGRDLRRCSQSGANF